MSRIDLFRVLHLRQLRRQPVRVVLAVVAVAAGVSMTVAGMLLVSSFEYSVRELSRALAGPAPLRVTGPLRRGGLDESVTKKVAAVPGVAAVVPMVQSVGIAERHNGRQVGIVAVGVDCRIEALVGAFGCESRSLQPPRPGAPVLMSATLRRELGDGGVIRTDIGRVPIAGVAVNDTLDGTNHGHVAIFDLPTAQRVFSRQGRIDVLYVRPDKGANVGRLQARIRNVVGGWNTVLRRDELGPLEGFAGPLVSILGLTAAMALGLSGLLVYNIVSLSLAERRRDLAVAGAVGAGPRAITSSVLAEAGLLGLAGGAVGAVLGIGFGDIVVAQAASAVLEQATGIHTGLHISPLVLLAGVGLGVITSLFASYVPARRARRLDLAAEIHGRTARAEEDRRRARLRLTVFVVGSAAAIFLSYVAQRNGALQRWQPPLGAISLALAAFFLFAAVGATTPLLLRIVLRPLRATGGPIRVAVSNLVANPRRTSVMAAAAGAAVSVACVLGAIGPATRDAVRTNLTAATDGRVWVSTLSANNSGTVDARPSPRVLKALRSVPGVASVDAGPCVFLADRAGFMGVCAYDGPRVIPFGAISGDVSSRALGRGEIILGPGAARSRGLRPGSTLHMPTPTRFAHLRVAGIWTNANMNGYSATVSRERFEELFGQEPSPAVLLRLAPGVSPDVVVGRIKAARLDPDLYALTPEQYSARLAYEIGTQVTPFWTFQRILLLVALVATLSTLLLVGVQRRRELGILGAVGFGPRGLARMTIGEAAGAALAGGVLGVVSSLGLFEAFRNVAVATVGTRAPFTFAFPTAVVAVALAVVVVAIGGLLPAWRTSRLEIVEAIRDE